MASYIYIYICFFKNIPRLSTVNIIFCIRLFFRLWSLSAPTENFTMKADQAVGPQIDVLFSLLSPGRVQVYGPQR